MEESETTVLLKNSESVSEVKASFWHFKLKSRSYLSDSTIALKASAGMASVFYSTDKAATVPKHRIACK